MRYALPLIMTLSLTACDAPPSPGSAPPAEQSSFLKIIEKYRNAYENAKNAWIKDPLREERGKSLCNNTQTVINGWLAAVDTIYKTSDGDALFEVKIGQDTWLTATPSAFLIRKDHPYFAVITTLGEGDRVRVWGRLVRATGDSQGNERIDCYKENSIFERGTMLKPEFMFYLDRIEKI